MSNPSMKIIAEIAEVVGTSNAIKLAAFFGGAGQVIYVPKTADDKQHILAKFLGTDGFELLCKRYSGQRLRIPNLEVEHIRKAGKVWLLKNNNVSTHAIAKIIGICPEHVRRISAALKSDGYFEFCDEMENGGHQDVY